jgi:hypothetical protein
MRWWKSRGPWSVGKTTLIHEFAYQRAAARDRKLGLNDGVWLLSP